MQLRRADVVAKATQLLDDYGIADLTMRRLARELNVSPGALYWHFADKQELLGAVADRILAGLDSADLADHSDHASVDAPDAPEIPWPSRIRDIGTGLRNALLSTTDGGELVSATLASGKSAAMAAVLDRLTTAAAAAGVTAEHAVLVARTIVHYVLGFTSDEQSRIQWDAAGALDEEQSMLGSGLDADPTARFGFGLDLLIAGVAQVPGRVQV